MTKLSPKAVRFVDAAVAALGNDEITVIWHGFQPKAANELPNSVAKAVFAALQQAERRLRSQIDAFSVEEDDASDLSNDLAFISAIKRDLMRQLKRAPGCSSPTTPAARSGASPARARANTPSRR
jgi:hypothetical protein